MSEKASQAEILDTAPGPIIVFAGPCLPRELNERWRAALDGVEIWPPAQRGDILRAVGLRPSVLILLDGLYYSVPSVTHKELLYALDSGISVLGAASMGALRAAEMAAFGMEGIGRVFELFKSGTLDGDDEVAMLHGLEEHGYRPLTLALVEIRQALAEILDLSGLPPNSGDGFIAAAKALPFTERGPSRLLALAQKHLESGDELGKKILRRAHSHGVKQADALEALERVQERRSDTQPPSSRINDPAPLITTLFNHFREWYLRPIGRRPKAESDGTHRQSAQAGPSFLQAWQVVQLFHSQTPAWLELLRRRFLLASAAEAQGLEPAPGRLEDIEQNLLGYLGDCPLPSLEWAAEMRLEVLAESAILAFGAEASVERAGEILAPRFGFDRVGAAEKILQLVAVQSDLMPPWFLTRSFLFTRARQSALDLAASAYQIRRAFDSWSRGGRLTACEIQRVAAEVWGCQPEEVDEIGTRRALLSHGGSEERSSPGSLADAIGLIAAAERLPRVVNDYAQRRRDLQDSELTPPFLMPFQRLLLSGSYFSEARQTGPTR